jgi:antitoxin (DNA-binding transcriptional repressor) of toxin-antitoxin stability system
MTKKNLARLDDVSQAAHAVQDGEPILLEVEGQAIAAIVSLGDLALLEQRMEDLEDRLDRALAEEVLAGSVDATPYLEFRKELGLD